MSDYRTIEIDFDVHKLIEANRNNFSESANVVLRRLLRLKALPEPKAFIGNAMDSALGKPWVRGGLSLPHGTKLRMHYNKKWSDGVVLNGQLIVNGKAFKAPSPAASEVAITKRGEKTNLDGWRLWEAQIPGAAEWKTLDDLRYKYV
jgi:hypothetical protein